MTLLTVLITALVLDAILAGSALDRGIVGFPALRRLGVVAFARYARAADLANGLWFYSALAIGGTIAELASLIVIRLTHSSPALYWPAGVAFGASVANLLLTLRAAPAMFSIGRTDDQEELLALLHDRFVRHTYARLVFICLRFGAMVWALGWLAKR